MTITVTEEVRARLVRFDKTEVGRYVFDLLSSCRTELSERDDPDLEAFIEDIDAILGPVGDARDGGVCGFTE